VRYHQRRPIGPGGCQRFGAHGAPSLAPRSCTPDHQSGRVERRVGAVTRRYFELVSFLEFTFFVLAGAVMPSQTRYRAENADSDCWQESAFPDLHRQVSLGFNRLVVGRRLQTATRTLPTSELFDVTASSPRTSSFTSYDRIWPWEGVVELVGQGSAGSNRCLNISSSLPRRSPRR